MFIIASSEIIKLARAACLPEPSAAAEPVLQFLAYTALTSLISLAHWGQDTSRFGVRRKDWWEALVTPQGHFSSHPQGLWRCWGSHSKPGTHPVAPGQASHGTGVICYSISPTHPSFCFPAEQVVPAHSHHSPQGPFQKMLLLLIWRRTWSFRWKSDFIGIEPGFYGSE